MAVFVWKHDKSGQKAIIHRSSWAFRIRCITQWRWSKGRAPCLRAIDKIAVSFSSSRDQPGDVGPTSGGYRAGVARPVARSGGQSPEELLLEAVNVLSGEQRERVLLWLLGRLGSSVADPGLVQRSLVQTTSAQFGEDARNFMLSHAGAALGDEQQVVPVRFSSDQHAALREWCQRNGFSMATVVGGLAAQFLDAQRPVT